MAEIFCCVRCWLVPYFFDGGVGGTTFISVVIGATLGALAGFYRKGVDTIIMRIADIFMALPTLPLLIILGAVLSDLKVDPANRIYFLMLIIGVLSWTSLSRLVRGQILTLREQEFMQATEALGLRDRRKIFRHLLPNTIPTIIVTATLGVRRGDYHGVSAQLSGDRRCAAHTFVGKYDFGCEQSDRLPQTALDMGSTRNVYFDYGCSD